ncbi:coiled-coil domain-containing protein 42 like-2 [Sphaeramia orbicularis]|uniref:coiled-coil domain-containing protein 42 like-2 n=1 Tax=Sphaeramia orbicularis TaxID=375764 RepID=UPI001180F5A5|nr:cilia- and flagella-associated protein 73 [Sphaeramia orbicularis]
MDLRASCEERVSPSLGVSAGGTWRDWTDCFFETQKIRREDAELSAKFEERKQALERVHQRKDEVLKESTKIREFYLSYDEFLQGKDAGQTLETAEKETKEVLLKEAEIQKLKEEYNQLKERKCELLLQEEKSSVYQDFMERSLKFTKFEDLQELTGHLESLLLIKDQLSQRENDAQEQLDQQKKALLMVEDQHRLMILHKNNQLSQLQTELEKTRTEALIWERKWNHFQDTAAKKTLLLGKIKMATLNLYEVTGGDIEGEEGVDVNATETQLQKVRIFIQDNDAIVKEHQSASHQSDEGQKRDKAKKHSSTHNKQ